MEVNPPDVYNALAGSYDEQLAQDPLNQADRGYVQSRLEALPNPAGDALDFGAGTGLDLLWLSRHYAKVYAFEPSPLMKDQARSRCEKLGLANVEILGGVTLQDLSGKRGLRVSLVLANFGVLNSMMDIAAVFACFHALTIPGASVTVAVLRAFPRKKASLQLLQKLLDRLRMQFSERSFVVRGARHNTVIHTRRKMVAAARPWFRLESAGISPSRLFTVYTFRRRDV